jgi:phosphoglycolate phosphatase-like HAD superfamily hydrolase
MERDSRTAILANALAGVSALVFDWNGTILNDSERARLATNRVLGEMALPALSVERFRETFRLPMDNYFQSLGVLRIDIEEAVADWSRFLVGGHIELSAGVPELLIAAKSVGFPVAIVSAASEQVVRSDAMLLGIEESLSIIVGDSRVKSAALREISAKVDGPVLYCGDTEYDIIEAKVAGAIPVGFAGGYRPGEALREVDPLVVIDDFHEIAEALTATMVLQK